MKFRILFYKFRSIYKLLKGDRRTAIFAITTNCNCKCEMCGMHTHKPKSISLPDAKKVLAYLSENKFTIVQLTGGEPILHPNLHEIIRYANELGLITSLVTNGTTPNKIKELKEVGLPLISISLDHWDAKVCEQIRGFENIQTREIEAIKNAKEYGLTVYALTYLNPYLDNIERMVDFVNKNLGVPVGFCYPASTDVNSYRLHGAESSRINHIVKTLLELKKKRRFGVFRKYDIANSQVYFKDIINFHEKKTPEVFCSGGDGVIYIDWSGDICPCFNLPKLFNINDENKQLMHNSECNQCLINCFREPSGLFRISPWSWTFLRELSLLSYKEFHIILRYVYN